MAEETAKSADIKNRENSDTVRVMRGLDPEPSAKTLYGRRIDQQHYFPDEDAAGRYFTPRLAELQKKLDATPNFHPSMRGVLNILDFMTSGSPYPSQNRGGYVPTFEVAAMQKKNLEMQIERMKASHAASKYGQIPEPTDLARDVENFYE